MIALKLQYLLCVLLMGKYGTLAANLINICHYIVVPQNRNSRPGRDIGSCESLVNHDFQKLLTISVEFLHIYIWKQLHFLSRWNNVEVVRSVCLTPVSMATWRFHTLWHFTCSLYQRIAYKNECLWVQWYKYFHEWKMRWSIQQGEAEVNGTFHLTRNENICSIAQMRKHSLFVLHNLHKDSNF